MTRHGDAPPALFGSEGADGRLGGRVGFGRVPALVVVDVQRGFTDPASPLGAVADTAIACIGGLAQAAHSAGIPVIYTVCVWHPEATNWARKIPAQRTLIRGSVWTELDGRLSADPRDAVVEKHFASAFFRTGLDTLLTERGVDTVIVTGLTTAGCVRATVVDGCSHGFRVIVPAEAVADRDSASHAMSLADMDGRYADVLACDEVAAHLASSTDVSTTRRHVVRR
jgi:maleamate amidohydrolase